MAGNITPKSALVFSLSQVYHAPISKSFARKLAGRSAASPAAVKSAGASDVCKYRQPWKARRGTGKTAISSGSINIAHARCPFFVVSCKSAILFRHRICPLITQYIDPPSNKASLRLGNILVTWTWWADSPCWRRFDTTWFCQSVRVCMDSEPTESFCKWIVTSPV